MSIQLPGLPSLDQVATAAAPNVQPYATPAALKAQRDYAEALMHGAVGKGGAQFPVVQSWTQGASNMLNALMGGLDMRNAENREQNSIGSYTQPPAGAAPATSDPTKPSSFTDGSSSEGREKTSDDDNAAPQPKGDTKVAAAGDPVDYGTNSRAIAGIESGGSKDPYHLHGPTILNPRSAYFGDQAHGKYQVMGKNVGPWTKDVIGRAETPDEFDNDPATQEAVFKAKFKNPTQWFGSGKSDGYTTGDAYRARFAAAGGRPVNGPATATAFAGPDAQPPAVVAMTAALRGGDQPTAQPVSDTQVAAGKPVPNVGFAPGQQPLPNPSKTGIYYDPRLIKPPPQYTPDQMRALQNSPVLDPAAKFQALQEFRQQGQPMRLPYPGGTVIVDPRNPSVQQFIPEGHWGQSTNKMGDLEQTAPTFQVPNASGGIQTAPMVPPPAAVGPRSEAAPPPPPPVAEPAPAGAIAPAGGPPGVPAIRPPPAVTTASAAPAMTPVAAPGAGAPVPPAVAAAEAAQTAGKPVQVASLDPAAGVAQAAGKPPIIPAAATEATVPEGPLAKWAQATPPGAPASAAGSPGQNEKALNIQSFPPGMVHDYQSMQDYKKNLAVDEDAQKKGTEQAMTKYKTLSEQGQSSRLLHNNVDLALGILNDPNMHEGMLAGAKDIWSRFKEAALGDKYANAPNETFDKLMAGNVLGTMKAALGGLGQVRLAEIQLLNKANGNRYNTDASNRAVLEISRRGLEKVDQIDGMGQEYATGGAVHDPISGKEILAENVDRNGETQPRRGLDAGFDKIVRKFTNDNPSFTPEQIKHYETIFDTGRPPEEAKAEGAKTQEKVGGAPQVGDTREFDTPDGKGKVTGVWDGKTWGPKK